MSCRAMRDRVQAYADGELGTEGVLEAEAHLAHCPPCREAFERQRGLGRAIATLYPRPEPPPAIEDAIREQLRGRSRRGLARAAAVAAAVTGVGIAALLAGRGDAAMPPEVRAALGLHRAAESGAVALGLASSDVGEVNRWLRREVPFVTELSAAAMPGFALEGAAAVELAGQRAGHVLYRADARPISLFVLPQRVWPPMGRTVRSGNVEFRWLEAGDERVVAWSHDPVSYLLVSDAARAPSEACGVCHSTVGAGGAGSPPADALHGGNPS